MLREVEHWRQTQITDERAKLIFYAALVDGKLEAPKSLLQELHRLYFEPQYEEFSARTMWSLSNALRLQEAGFRFRSSRPRPNWVSSSPTSRHNLRDLRLTLPVSRDRAFALSKHVHFTQFANIENSQE